jgi:hypothetical protein
LRHPAGFFGGAKRLADKCSGALASGRSVAPRPETKIVGNEDRPRVSRRADLQVALGPITPALYHVEKGISLVRTLVSWTVLFDVCSHPTGHQGVAFILLF